MRIAQVNFKCLTLKVVQPDTYLIPLTYLSLSNALLILLIASLSSASEEA